MPGGAAELMAQQANEKLPRQRFSYEPMATGRQEYWNLPIVGSAARAKLPSGVIAYTAPEPIS